MDEGESRPGEDHEKKSDDQEQPGLKGLQSDIEDKMTEGAEDLEELRKRFAEGEVSADEADERAQAILGEHDSLVEHRRTITGNPPGEEE